VSGLACLQHGFQDYLLHREQRITDQLIVTKVQRAGAIVDLRRRLSSAFISGVGDKFCALHALLGDMAFDRLGRAYIDAHPSQHPSLRWFGRQVSKFLRQTPLYASQPILAEMAAFEWAQGEVFDAEDADVINIETIGALALDVGPTMRLVLHPSVQCVNCDWNVPTAWQAIDEQEPRPRPSRPATKPRGCCGGARFKSIGVRSNRMKPRL
jgi:hypothetical protein